MTLAVVNTESRDTSTTTHASQALTHHTMAKHPHYCTSVTPSCPVTSTVYGYYPSLPGNILLCIVFFLCLLLQLYYGIRYKTRGFTIALTIGCFAEALGYIGRILLHSNPWNQSYFDIQICCLVLAPSFLAAGVYLALKGLVIKFGSEKSRLRPGLYPWVFVGCDVVSILMQAAGGGAAATEDR